jgi:hypothetical protein
MRFRITVHSGFDTPDDALDILAERLGRDRDDARFERRSTDIVATWGEDAPVSMESDEREELGRLAVLGILEDICDSAPELKLDWFAVSTSRY